MSTKDRKEKAIAYNLIVDEQTSDTLNWIFSVYFQKVLDNDPEILESPDFKTYHRFSWDLFTEIGKKTHELNWCKDPECPEKKPLV